MLGNKDQVIGVGASVRDDCRPGLHKAVLRIAHELVGDAIEHGTHAFLMGSIDVRLETANGYAQFTVTHDNWAAPRTCAQARALNWQGYVQSTRRRRPVGADSWPYRREIDLPLNAG